MKQTLIIAAVVLALFLGIYSIISCCVDTQHRYEIGYNHGKYFYADYTDTFKLGPTSIDYIDEHGKPVTRYGTFSIKPNPDFKK